jgi:SAM-dependent methyltransferase
MNMNSSDNKYWDLFYKSNTNKDTIVNIPSQFAAFVAGELSENVRSVVEFGCGTGRDVRFFRRLGLNVLGIDNSESAIELCRSYMEEPECRFEVRDVRNIKDFKDLGTQVNSIDGPKIVYSRFFLHAIDEISQNNFLDIVSRITVPGEKFAVEFRTIRDANLRKESDEHFRRYIEPVHLIAEVLRRDFSLEYFVEGFGFAKYRNDDAHVARMIFERS